LSCQYYGEHLIESSKGRYIPRYKCRYKRPDNGQYCIFHEPNNNNKKAPFFQELEKIIGQSQKYDMKLICTGFIFPKVPLGNFLNQKELSFGNEVFFQNCVFDELFLQDITFKRNVYFNNSIFRGDCTFNFCKSIGKAFFNNAKFMKKLQFNNQCFGDVEFEGSEFYGPAIFYPYCKGSFYIKKSCFHDSASFNSTNFWGKENSFIYTSFKGKVDFTQTTFTHNGPGTRISITRFERCDFSDEVDFIYTDFPKLKQRIITFSYDPESREDYENEDYFRGFLNNLLNIDLQADNVRNYIKINERLNEVKVDSHDLKIHSIKLNLSFFDRTIRNRLSPKSYIRGNLLVMPENEITYTKLLKLFLEKSRKKKELFFINDFTTNPNNIPFGFDYSTFRKRVRFIGLPDKRVSLTGISFKGVDLSNFEFHNVEWIEKSEIIKSRLIVIDELFDTRFRNFEEISKIYNQLRKNYESKLLFNEASNFFIGEMEAIRKSKWCNNKSISKLNTVPYLMYKYLSLYGESIKLPLLIWMPIIIVSFGLVENQLSKNLALVDSLKQSFFNFFPIPSSITTAQLSDIFAIEKIISIPILGLAFIALRRRFERSK
jgi:hypothetical protein